MPLNKKITNIVYSVLVSVLTIFLAALLISSPLFAGVSNFREPEKIASLAAQIEVEKLLVSSEEIGNAAEEVGLTEEAVEGVLKSAAIHEVLTLYAADFLNAVKGKEANKNLTPEKIPAIAEKHIDEIAVIIKETVPDAKNLSNDELKEEILATANKYSKRIVSALPSFEQIEEISKEPEFQSAVTLIKNEDYLTSLITLIVFLSVVILLIKIRKVESFLYLGGAYLVSGLAVLIAAVSSSAEKVLEDMLIFLPLGSLFNSPITDFVNGTLYTGFLILFIIGAAFLGGYFAIRYFKNKKEKVD